MLNEYSVTVHITGHYTIEDPKCPSSWRGSGCYDIEVETWADQAIKVWAVSAQQASELAEDYDGYDCGYTICIEDVYVEKVEFVRALPNKENDEAGVVEDFNLEWKECTDEPPEYEPDPFYEKDSIKQQYGNEK